MFRPLFSHVPCFHKSETASAPPDNRNCNHPMPSPAQNVLSENCRMKKTISRGGFSKNHIRYFLHVHDHTRTQDHPFPKKSKNHFAVRSAKLAQNRPAIGARHRT